MARPAPFRRDRGLAWRLIPLSRLASAPISLNINISCTPALVRRALELCFTLLDIAAAHGTEGIVGVPCDSVVIATKANIKCENDCLTAEETVFLSISDRHCGAVYLAIEQSVT